MELWVQAAAREMRNNIAKPNRIRLIVSGPEAIILSVMSSFFSSIPNRPLFKSPIVFG
ncbi:hypothetical protein LEP1GSC178_1258 [Leptospira licerasiae str. MMD4847]|uniref:Uncharacterized protein n=1 Tax=Leptospira licerasiae str. MMD4847 TaxID=1049971 RepID=A0ABN0H702_9LEPT|nr:hypothetical protein LEP1GSC178_1258 [Leptospira licerasiae str. MMD4847]